MTLDELKSRCHITADKMWLWKGAVSRGKPQCWHDGKSIPARRVAYMLKHGLTDLDMGSDVVWNISGNNLDINPDNSVRGNKSQFQKHLVETHPTKLMSARVAIAKASTFKKRRFTHEQAQEILHADTTDAQEAERHGVSAELIRCIRKQKLYKPKAIPNSSVFSFRP